MKDQKISNVGRKILCIGADLLLLDTRRMVLNSQGFQTTIAIPEAVDEALFAAGFDLVIVSASVEEPKRSDILAMIPSTAGRLELDTLVMPGQLLNMIEKASMERLTTPPER